MYDLLKMSLSPPIQHLRSFGTVTDIASVFHSTKNQARGLCIGRFVVILNSPNRTK